jgi:hypothetical protein
MLPLDKYVVMIREWADKNLFGNIKISAGKRLEALGYIDLGVGSWFRFIHKEWFIKARDEGIIKQNAYNQWVPFVEVANEQEVIGMRGKTEILSSKKTTKRITKESMERLRDFDRRYQEWMKSQEQIELSI